MAANIFLLKHGEALVSNLDKNLPVPSESQNVLSEVGRTQIKEIAIELKKLTGPIKILSSPSPRVKESALILSNLLDVVIEESDLLGDRLQSIEGLTIEQYRAIQDTAATNPFERAHGGESFLEHKARVVTWAVDFMTELKADKSYIIVTHGATIEHLQSILQNQPFNSSQSSFVSCYPGRFHQWIARHIEKSGIIWELVAANSVTLAVDPYVENKSDFTDNTSNLDENIPSVEKTDLGNEILFQKDILSEGGSASYHR